MADYDGDGDGAHGAQTCTSCGGYTQHLGVLGRRAVYRCRQCGDTTSHPLDNESYRYPEA